MNLNLDISFWNATFQFFSLKMRSNAYSLLETGGSVQTITLKLRKHKEKDKFGPIGNFLWIDIHVSINSHKHSHQQTESMCCVQA